MRGIFGLSLQQHLMVGAAVVAVASASPAQAQTKSFDVPAQPASQGIPAFAKQAGVQIIASGNLVRDRRTNAVKCTCTVEEGLRKLLDGTGLTAGSPGATGIITVVSAVGNANVAVTASDGDTDASFGEDGISEILVVGQRGSLNGDVRRTENDVQPYVVLSGEEIRRSGAATIEDFLRTHLPMNAQQRVNAQTPGNNTGGIRLRGLNNQTLILVDGRRVPDAGVSGENGTGQPNINGIPPSAIERIEVLPATAGGIYGGTAVGGVVNVILKRDYSGFDLEGIFGSAFDGKSPQASFSFSGGFPMENGRSRVFLSASRSHRDMLVFGDRNFQIDGRTLNWANRRADFTAPPLSNGTNFCSAASVFSASCSTTPLVFDGAFGGGALGSNIGTVPLNYAGIVADGTAPLLARAGNFDLHSAHNVGTLLSKENLQSYTLTLRRDFGAGFNAFLDVGYDEDFSVFNGMNAATFTMAADDPSNPFQQNLLVTMPLPNSVYHVSGETDTYRARTGLIKSFRGGWSLGLEHSWGENINERRNKGQILSLTPAQPYLRTIALIDPNSIAVDEAQLGAPAFVREGPFKTITNDTIARFSGHLIAVPGGSVVTSGYLERRKEKIDDSVFENGTDIKWYPAKSQLIRSGYLEIRAPIFSSATNIPFVKELELFGSIRRDRYDVSTAIGPAGGGFPVSSREGPFPAYTTEHTNFASTNYTVGIRYQPISDVTFRASFGTGFLPPRLGALIPTSTLLPASSAPFVIPSDPKRGDTPSPAVPITVIGTGNPNLLPEDSKSLSMGAILTPRFIKGLRVSIDYTRIKKTNELDNLSLANTILREDDFPGRIVRGPNIPGDLSGWAGPIQQIDLSPINLQRTRVAAYDFQVDYSYQSTSVGIWQPYLIATYQPKLERLSANAVAPLNLVGFSDGPLKWRINAGFTWRGGAWLVGWNSAYFGSYDVCVSSFTSLQCDQAVQRQGRHTIRGQIYSDAYIERDLGDIFPRTLLKDTKLRLGVQNIFDEAPPALAVSSGLASGYDFRADPRRRRFTLAVMAHFGK